MIPGLEIIEKEIKQKAIDELNKIGLLYRIFTRVKNDKSINEKILRKEKDNKPYSIEGKKIQDIIGIRIVTYFKDDVELVKEILSNKFNYLDEEIDDLELTVFKPKRTNIICLFNEKQKRTLKEIQETSSNSNTKLIDNTFELQLRTMLSEGWHEIDHSLRYKCKDDWENHKESERLLNGVYASLETNDIAMKNLFNELAYKHFKKSNWEALIRTKFRLQFQLVQLKQEFKEIMNNDKSIGKQIIKLERQDVLLSLSKLDISLPVSLNNLLMLINFIYIKNERILELTPSLIKTIRNNA